MFEIKPEQDNQCHRPETPCSRSKESIVKSNGKPGKSVEEAWRHFVLTRLVAEFGRKGRVEKDHNQHNDDEIFEKIGRKLLHRPRTQPRSDQGKKHAVDQLKRLDHPQPGIVAHRRKTAESTLELVRRQRLMGRNARRQKCRQRNDPSSPGNAVHKPRHASGEEQKKIGQYIQLHSSSFYHCTLWG